MIKEELFVILLAGAALVGIGILAGGVLALQAFRKDLDYIKREIARTEGEERQYWQQEKRQLWLSLLPFYRR